MKRKKQEGVTLIEVMVSLTLFITIVVIVSGSIMSMLESNRVSRVLQQSSQNIDFIMEEITKNMRVGRSFEYATDPTVTACPHQSEGKTGVAFIPSFETSGTSEITQYFKEGGTVYKKVGGGSKEPLTIPGVSISDLCFIISGQSKVDSLQPHVTVILSGTITSRNSLSRITYQTGITQRSLDTQ